MEHAQIRSAFNDFLRSHEATLTPTGFLHWVSVHQPALVEALGTVAVMTFAAEYLATPFVRGPPPPTRCDAVSRRSSRSPPDDPRAGAGEPSAARGGARQAAGGSRGVRAPVLASRIRSPLALA